MTRLKRSLQVWGLPCFPPRCGTDARASQYDSRSTNELWLRVVPPPSAPLSFLRLLPNGSTIGVDPLVVVLMGSPTACLRRLNSAPMALWTAAWNSLFVSRECTLGVPEKSTFEKRHSLLCSNASFRWSSRGRRAARRARASASCARMSSNSWRCSFLIPFPNPSVGTSKALQAGGLALRSAAVRAVCLRALTRSISDLSSWAHSLPEEKKTFQRVSSLPFLNESTPRRGASDGHRPGVMSVPAICGRALLRVLRKAARRSVLR